MPPSPPERLSRAEVTHVAKLARLALTEEEIERYGADLAKVLDHAEDIAALNLDDLEPTAHPFPLENVLRDDTPRPSLSQSAALAAAPAVEGGRFRVPRILEEEP